MKMHQDTIPIAEGRESCHKYTEQWTIEGMPQLIKEARASMGPGPSVVVLACRWRYFAAGDLEGLKRLASSVEYRVVRAPCCGQVDAHWVATALDAGAEAVLVMGGHPSRCSFADDPADGERNLRSLLERLGRDPGRLVVDWSDGDDPESFQGSLDRLVAAVENNESGRR